MFYFILTGLSSIVFLIAGLKLCRLAHNAKDQDVKRLAWIMVVIAGCLAVRGDYTIRLIHHLQTFVSMPKDQQDF